MGYEDDVSFDSGMRAPREPFSGDVRTELQLASKDTYGISDEECSRAKTNAVTAKESETDGDDTYFVD